MKYLIHNSLGPDRFTISKHSKGLNIPFNEITSSDKAETLEEAKEKICKSIDKQVAMLLKNRDEIMRLKVKDIT